MTAADATHIRLKNDHDALRIIMQRFVAAMQDGENADRVALLRDRVAFSQLFTRHIREEQQSISALRLDRLSPEAAAAVKARETGMLALRLDYSAHINFWKPDVIARDERGYAEAVLCLQRRLKEYMALEEEHIFPLLARTRLTA